MEPMGTTAQLGAAASMYNTNANNGANNTQQIQGGKIAANQAQANYGYNTNLAAQGYQSAAQLNAATNASNQAMNTANNATQQQGNQLQYQSSILGPTLKQQRFNTVLPMFSSALGSLNSS